MSFEMFVFTIGEDDSFERAIVERAFAPRGANLATGYWSFRRPDGESGSFYITLPETERIDGFSFNRPPTYADFPGFWEALFDVMRLTRTIITWPSTPMTCCIANPSFASELPPGFIEVEKQLHIVSSGAEIIAIIDQSG